MPDLDGLVTFFGSHHAIRAEKVLDDAGFVVVLIAGPKEVSPNCGTALRFEFPLHDDVRQTLDDKRVEVDQIIEYVPRTDGFRRRGLLGRRRS